MVNSEEGCNQSESISEFFAGKSVFVTGGTGFLGKVLIEKLLYSCSSIDKIYVLIRKKRGRNPDVRMQSFYENVIFSRIRNERPSDLEKVVPVIGDMSEPNLGLEHSVISLLIQKVSALVHVSTAYSNTEQDTVEERVYPPPNTLQEIDEFLNKSGDDVDARNIFLKKKPNTYAYTKSMAEYLVSTNQQDIPTAIVRPSIVLSTLKDPLPGWLENWNGPTGLMYAAARGVHRFMAADAAKVLDLIPVDTVANMTIAAAAACKNSKELKVYNCCSSPRNPITNGEFLRYFMESGASHHYGVVPYPFLILIKSTIMLSILKFFLVLIPAYVMDLFLRLFGRKPKYVKLQAVFQYAEDMLKFFTLNEWTFRDENVRVLIRNMTPEDRDTFYCDPADINWRKYVDDYVVGIDRFLVKKDKNN
uniref:Fatty acyl-CoA reductase n=1 Tax=Plutella xylostella TaxID=51655 RepID=A0A1L8D6A3_PLUXY